MDYWKYFPNFKPTEFKCSCGCCKSVPDMDVSLLFILQTVRNIYGPVVITSGFRCKKHNDSITGSSKNSFHCKKKAADFYIKGVTDSLSKRKEIMELMKKLPNYRYTYCNENGSHPNMGNSIHIDVK